MFCNWFPVCRTIAGSALGLAFGSVLFLASMGCNNSPSPVASGAPPVIPATVGPVPGGLPQPQGPANPLAGDPVALQDGRRLFLWFNCVGCHGGHGGGGMGPTLRHPNFLFGHTDAQIFDSIAEGRSEGMPAWGTRIPEQQIWELVAYIQSMRTPQEPDPPDEPANEQVSNPDNNDRIGIGTQFGH
jgi:cytochrome c oxidase cbb3-type subunit 3